MRNPLKLRYVPPSVKLQMIRTQLLPVAMWAGELLSTNNKLTRGTEVVWRDALRWVYGTNVASTTALASESGLESIKVIHNGQRLRAFQKWKTSSTIISTLIRCAPVTRKWTWVTGTKRWAKTYCPTAWDLADKDGSDESPAATPRQVSKQARRERWEIERTKSSALGMKLYLESKFDRSSVDLRSVAHCTKVHPAAQRVIHSMRCGAFWSALKLSQWLGRDSPRTLSSKPGQTSCGWSCGRGFADPLAVRYGQLPKPRAGGSFTSG